MGGNYQPVAVPPLPSLPAQYAGRSQPARRAASLEPSMRSPPASPQRSVRGGSVRGGSISPVHTRISSLTTVPEQERPNSRGSVNFSYPRGTRPNSPPPSPLFVENRTLSLGPAISPAGPRDPQTTPQKQVSKPRAQHEGTARDQPADKSAAPAVGTAIAAAQAVSAQKSSPRAEPHARADRVEHEPSVGQQYQAPRHGTSTVEDSDNDHPSSRAVPDRWPATVPEKTVPKGAVNIEASPSHETANRHAASSPTPDHIDTEVTPQSSPSVAIRDPQLLEERQSNSPGRSARFSKWLSVSGTGSQIHQPPGRSVSPVKSALKHPRGSSLSPDRKVSAAGLTIQTPSEISDGTSVASDEGSRLGVKKRMPKVSFDDEAEIVGVAASPPTSPEEYTLGSPPPKAKSRMSWLGVGKKRQTGSELGAGDNDFDQVLKPRQTLPSFGSVRGNRDGGPQEPVIPEYSDNESSDSSDDEIVTAGASFSNDHALGGILHKPQEVAKTHNVKSVEQLSVTGEPTPAPAPVPVPVPADQPVPETKSDGVAIGSITEEPPFVSAEPDIPPPSIAVEPATPPVGSDRPSKELQRVSRSSLEGYPVPGGFPPSASDRNLKSTAEASAVPQPVASAIPTHVDDADTEESDGSVYSDAAEDFDGDGFGSINAIVDQKPIPRSSAPAETVRESRDTTPKPADRTSLIVDDESMDVTEQVADEGRAATPTQDSVNRQIEESAAATAVPAAIPQQEDQLSAPASPVSPVKSKTCAVSHGPLLSETNEQRRPISMNVYGASSVQNSQPTAAGSSVPPAGRGKQRPVSLGPAFHGTKSSGGAAFPSSLRRTTSNGSDSSSSFKRASSSNRGGSRPMRRTMRASSSYMPGPPSDRTDSPTDLRPMSSGSSPGTLRKTLRGPPGGAGNERLSFFSTNKKAVPGQRPRLSKAPQGSRFRDSDGEGDADRPQVFRSRFADSSDEEERGDSSMRPVRGIPRRHGAHDGDSTDLEDSSEEERRHQSKLRPVPGAARKTEPTPPTSRDGNVPPNMSGMAAVARQRGMTQRELEEFIMQPKARKGGFLSRIGLKKSKTVDNRIRKNDMESPTRTDTPLERSRLEREQLRSEDYSNNARAPAILTTVTATQPEQPSSPKLLKKNSKRHTTGGAPWPLRTSATNPPEPIPEQTASAPISPLRTQKPPVHPAGRNGSVTINGAAQVLGASPTEAPASPQNARAGPDPNDDAASDITRSTDDHGPVARDVVIAGSGRKKRFPMLRKAFGLRA